MLVEGDMQGLVIAISKLGRNRLREIHGLVGGLSPQPKGVGAGPKLNSFRGIAVNAFENSQVLLTASA